MKLVHTVVQLQAALQGQSATAFVPTMGNLHAGHVSLIALAKQHGQPVVASIFVNPLQFSAGEDFERYPRTLDADYEKLAAAGCELVFAPDEAALYPVAQTFTVQPPQSLTDDLCGAHRPGHFSGVATVLLKFFNLIQPRTAIFGRKDFQQLQVVRELVRQFNLPINIIAGSTLREADGLAMSSRNQFLSASERIQATGLYGELSKLAEALTSGDRKYAELIAAATKNLKMAGWMVDYVAVRDAQTLEIPLATTEHVVVLGAASLGNTRLIDNIEHTLLGVRA